MKPRFIDSVQVIDPIARGGGASNPAAWASVGSVPFSNSDDAGRNQQLTQRYTYWNYIAISRVAERIAQTFPCIGVPAAASGSSRMSQSQRAWLVQRYGWEQFSAPDVEIKPIPDTHPFVALLKSVNPRDTWQEFIADTVVQWDLTGRFVWWAIPNGIGLPVQLWVIPTAWVNRVWNQDGSIRHYEVMPTKSRFREPLKIPPNEIILGEYRSPEDPNESWSGLKAAPLWSEGVDSIERSRAAHFRNGVRPDLLLHIDRETYGNPNDDILNRIKERFVQRTSGVHRSGEPVLIPSGVKAEKWGNSPKEMDYPLSADQLRDNSLAVEGTPNIVAGISQDYNRETANAAFEVWCDVIINPKFRRLAGVLQEKLAVRFDPRILVYFPDCRPKNAEHRLKEMDLGLQRGGVWPDEYRQEIGLEPIGTPPYQTGWISTAVQPLDESQRQPEPLPEEPDD